MHDLNNQCREWLQKVNSQIHGSTHEIPLQRLKDEKLNPLSSVPAYMTRKVESRKISRDCYVSYRGNRYSVPWKYAGGECRIIEESALVKIEIDSSIVADHCTVYLKMRQNTKRIKRYFPPLHLLFFS